MGPRGAKARHGLLDWNVHGCGVLCTYCDREMIPYSDSHPTRDHVYPKSRGGHITVWACGTCNQLKRDMMPDEWKDFMAENPRWWAKQPSLAYVKPCPVLVMVSEFFMTIKYGKWTPRSRVGGQTTRNQ